jgi:hypothetical protein
MPGWCFRLGHNRFLQRHFRFINHTTIRYYVTCTIVNAFEEGTDNYINTMFKRAIVK